MTAKRTITGACTRCGEKVTFIEGHEPNECQACGSPLWRAAINPVRAFAISTNDRRFLKSIRVNGDA